MNLAKIDTLIFDLGGVIINLDTHKTITRLAELARLEPKHLIDQHWQHPVFQQYEKGEVDDDTFRNFLRHTLKTDSTDAQLDEAWNAMILDIPADRLRLLKRLKEDYQIFLLSNTNNIHLQRVNKVFTPLDQETLDHYFDYCYYSHHMGMRKPDHIIFEKVVEEQKLNPSKTIFFDDNEQNIEGAKGTGLQTFWVKDPETIKGLFDAEEI